MRLKVCWIILLLLATFVSAEESASTIAGHWEGKITLQAGVELGVILEVEKEGDTWKGDIDIPVQSARDLPLINFRVEGTDAEFEISGPPGKPTFHGKLSADGNEISGNFTQAGQSFPFTLARGSAAIPESKGKPEAEILDDIRAHVKSTMAAWNVPGLALAIVKDGKVLLTEGFGVRNIETKEAVTPETLFAIGSSTKAFTATLMGICVDEGKVKWEEPIRKHLPSFDLQDQFAEQQMSPKDLLTHRSGLPRHDVVWYGSTLSRKELFERLKYLQPSGDFRTIFQYQNLMFMTAGYLEEQVNSGTPWEKLISEKILSPLGMTHSNTSVTEMEKATDHALPYEYKAVDEKSDKKELRVMPFRNIDAIGPAGSINSNITDMTRWVLMNLGNGSVDGKSIITPAALEEIHSPQMVVRGGIFAQLFAFPETPYMSYGMGWFVQPYRGRRLLHHGGNIDGFSAMVSFMPDEKLGVVILTNLDGNLQVDSLMFEIYDRLLRLDLVDWNSRYKLLMAQIEAAGKESEKKEDEVRRKKSTKTSHPIADYAGAFQHPAYGTLNVDVAESRLNSSLHGLATPLEHFHYDVFRGVKNPLKGLKLTFLTNLRGDIDRVSVPLEDGVDEIVFTRIPPAEMRDPQFLSRFTGEYDMMGLTVTVQVKEDHLTLTVPGQPTYTLEPYAGTEFDLKEQKGFSVKFTVVKDTVTEAVFIQPNGVFAAKKKQTEK